MCQLNSETPPAAQANLAQAKDSVPAVGCVHSVVKGQDWHILTAKHFVNSLALAGIQREQCAGFSM